MRPRCSTRVRARGTRGIKSPCHLYPEEQKPSDHVWDPGYGNFDIVSDHISRVSPPHPVHAVYFDLLGAHAYWRLQSDVTLDPLGSRATPMCTSHEATNACSRV